MQLSKYNFFDDRFATQEIGVIYNTSRGSILQIANHDLWSALMSNDLEKITAADQDLLFENKILVESSEKEFVEIRKRYETAVHSRNELYLTIMPTEDCNFCCPYCFVYEKKHGKMKTETYEKIFELVELTLTNNPCLHTIYLNWFGGEPSLCLEALIDFTRNLNHLAQKYNATIIGSITTNGYLIDKEAFLRLINVGIKNVQITIDGAKEAHDSVRHLRGGKGTFDVI